MPRSGPKADPTKPGAYQRVTPESHPQNFRAPGTEAQTAAQARAALDRMLLNVIYPRSANSRDPSVQAEEEEPSDDGDEDGSAGPIANPAPTNPQAIAQARAVALEPNDANWKRGQPKAQPLTYAVPTDANGGKVYRTFKFMVDFNDGDLVEKANRCRRQGLYRAAKKLGLPLKRPRTDDRPYTQANNNWIMARYDQYAATHHNYRITYRRLAEDYNNHFTNSQRSEASISSHIHRDPYLKAKKDSYVRQP